MDSLEYVDSLIKEYLLFRGFQSTLRAFESDLRSDKLTHLDADKLTSALLSAAKALDFPLLQDLWAALQRHVFPSLTHTESLTAARKMETSLFRFFMVCAVQQGKPHRVSEFLATWLTTDAPRPPDDMEWMHWAAIVHLKRPQSTPPFDVYFTKMWVDLFSTSLRNFLERALAAMPLPRLLNFNVERIQRKNLELEASKLREQVEYWKSQAAARPPSAPSTTTPKPASHLPPLSIPVAPSTSGLADPPTATHTPMGSTVGTPTTAMPTVAPGALHPDDEPYLVLEDMAVALDDTPRARIAVARDGAWVAVDAADASVRAWPIGKNAPSIRVTAGGGPSTPGGPVAEIVWLDTHDPAAAKGPLLAAVFSAGWVRCVAPESKSIVADVQLPWHVSAAAVAPGGLAVAGAAGVCLVSVKLASVTFHAPLPDVHADPTDKVLHVVVVDGVATAAAGRAVAVVSATWVHVYDLAPDKLTHTHSLPTPFPPLACFPHPPDPSFTLALVSSRGAVAVLNTKSGVIDPLLQYSLPGFPSGLASARACALVPAAPATLGRGDPEPAGGAGGTHFIVGDVVYLIPQGRMVQDLRAAPGVDAAAAPMALQRSNSSLTGPATRTLSRQGSVTSANNVVALAAASVAASAVTVSSGSAASWTPGASTVTSPVEASRQIAGGAAPAAAAVAVADRVTCVAAGKNVIVQGRASGVVRVLKIMVV